MSQSLLHYTLNTNSGVESLRADVADETVSSMMVLIGERGIHPLTKISCNMDEYFVKTTPSQDSLLFTILSGDRPLIVGGVTDCEQGADELWPTVEAFYINLTDRGAMASSNLDLPSKPKNLPWLASVLAGLDPLAVGWTGDVERSLAWAWMETRDWHVQR